MKVSTKVVSHSENLNERNRVAQAHWREYAKNPDEVDGAFAWFSESFPGIKPEAFECSGNARTRKAYKLLRGDVGRLRVAVGEPLELRRVGYDELPELASLAGDIFAQFEPDLVKLAYDALTRYVDGPLWGVIERGRVSYANHFHTLVKAGTCKLGVSCGVIQDAKLLERVAYLCKAPEWQLENVVGYLSVKQAYPGKPVGSRYCHRGLGNYRPSLATIEQALGFGLSKPVQADETPAGEKGRMRICLVFGDHHRRVGTDVPPGYS